MTIICSWNHKSNMAKQHACVKLIKNEPYPFHLYETCTPFEFSYVCNYGLFFFQAIILPGSVVVLLRVLPKKQIQPGLWVSELHPRVLSVRLLYVTDRRQRPEAWVQRELRTSRNQMQRLSLRGPLRGRNHFYCKLLGVRLFTINSPVITKYKNSYLLIMYNTNGLKDLCTKGSSL